MSVWGSQSLGQTYRFLSLPQTELFHNLRTFPGAIAPEWHVSSLSLPLATITFLPVLELVTLNSNKKNYHVTHDLLRPMCAPRDYPSYIWTFLFCFWAAGHRLWLYPLSYGRAFWPFVVFGYHQQSQYKQPHRESISTSFFKIFWDVIVLDYIGFLFFRSFSE